MLVDGEHYPPVILAALADLRARGTVPVAALFLGGVEKVAAPGAEVDLGVPVSWVSPAQAAADVVEPYLEAAASAISRLATAHGADLVVDLSDEPVLDPRRRLQLASHVLVQGLPYEGADFALRPPPRPRLARRTTMAVIGIGKRTGKTAMTGETARRLLEAGRTPVVVAMGRGGPSEPAVVRAGDVLDPAALLAVADGGGHAASDFYEDAVTTGAATVGARRCGGGLAGGVGHSNVAEAVAIADDLPGDITLLEGSGAAVPPVHADATMLVVPGHADPEFLSGYLGAYRLLLADLVVVTMAGTPGTSPDHVEAVLGAIRSISRRVPFLLTAFRPVPLGAVSESRVFFATTASPAVTEQLAAVLEEDHACEVVATSSRLADRPALRADLAAAPAFDVLLVELKAAAVDVAARWAAESGARVVFCDNRPVAVTDSSVAGDGRSLADAVLQVAALADARHATG